MAQSRPLSTSSTPRTEWVNSIVDLVGQISFPPSASELEGLSTTISRWTESETNERLAKRMIASLLFADKDDREFRICNAHRETFCWIYGSPRNDGRSW